ncbi:MAG: VanZ family protein [Candidatus Omnitrophota bacterium]
MIIPFIKYWLPVGIWAVIIFTLSSFSSFPDPVAPLGDYSNIWHLAEYAILSFLLARALKNSKQETLSQKFRILAFVLAVFYGISDEFHQYFVPLRCVSVLDLAFDAVGAFIGQMIYRT